jgi:hypothetical protein
MRKFRSFTGKSIKGIIVVAVLFVATGAAAQGSGQLKTPAERAKKLSDGMKSELLLTDEQYSKVHAVNLKYAEKNESIRSSNSGKLAKYRSIKSSQKGKLKEMKAILTPSQFEKYEKMLDEKEQEAREKYKG